MHARRRFTRLECLYFVREGSLKRERVPRGRLSAGAGGRRARRCDRLRGDLHPRHTNAVVALDDCSVYAITLSELDDLRARLPAALDPGAAADRQRPAGALGRPGRQLMWPCPPRSGWRGSCCCMPPRASERDHPPNRFRLSLSRRDIASLLGVARDRQPLVRRADRLGLPAGRSPRCRDPRPGRPGPTWPATPGGWSASGPRRRPRAARAPPFTGSTDRRPAGRPIGTGGAYDDGLRQPSAPVRPSP